MLWTIARQLLSPWDFQGKDTRVGSNFLLQGIFMNQEWNPHLLCLLHWQVGSLPLVPPRKPLLLSYMLTFHWPKKVTWLSLVSSSGVLHPALGDRVLQVYMAKMWRTGAICKSPSAIIMSRMLAVVIYCLNLKLFILETKINNLIKKLIVKGNQQIWMIWFKGRNR